jgi:undecaprenyl-diphosphatase
MDIYFFKLINGLANNSKFLDSVGIFFADYFPYILGAILVLLFIWKKNRLMVISVAISVFLSRLVIAEIIKIIFHRSRPYVVLDTAKKLITENTDFKSFPSGHAAIFFAIALAVYFYNKKLGIWFFVAAILIGIARIFVGVHWPSDVLGGAVIGIISGLIITRIIRTKTRVSNKQPNQIFSDTQSQ